MKNSWNDNARHILIDHIAHPEPIPGPALATINACLTNAQDAINTYIHRRTITTLHLDHIVTYELLYAARAARQQLKQLDLWSVDRLLDLLVYKQTNYGHGNILAFGIIGVGIRACDKRARLTNLQGIDQGDMRNETVVDTYDDLIGYAVIAKMLTDGTFTTELDPQ